MALVGPDLSWPKHAPHSVYFLPFGFSSQFRLRILEGKCQQYRTRTWARWVYVHGSHSLVVWLAWSENSQGCARTNIGFTWGGLEIGRWNLYYYVMKYPTTLTCSRTCKKQYGHHIWITTNLVVDRLYSILRLFSHFFFLFSIFIVKTNTETTVFSWNFKLISLRDHPTTPRPNIYHLLPFKTSLSEHDPNLKIQTYIWF